MSPTFRLQSSSTIGLLILKQDSLPELPNHEIIQPFELPKRKTFVLGLVNPHPEMEVAFLVPWLRMIDGADNETDDETNAADDTESNASSTRVRTGDTQSENDDVVCQIGDGDGNEQSHPHPAASPAHYSDFTSALLKSANHVEPQSVVRVGIHGIIGKEVIEGNVYVVRRSPPTAVREWRTPFPQRRDFLYAVRERRTPESTAYA
ncbi:MAG: hypothetical protein M1813_005622 [Trichoglossum hirsutum]|nr:MAG: hypothetical protein M1813_005622 [Trichoglossum hirsutum]